MTVSRRIAVIGGGAAGLINAKSATELGHEVTIYEIGSQLGGLWAYCNDSGRSSAYESLHINTPRRFTSFAAYPFRSQPALFPNHREIAQYLNDFADAFDLRRRVRFNSEVASVVPIAQRSKDCPYLQWRVSTVDGGVETFDAVIVATGHLSEPSLPTEFSSFAGELLHSHYYKEPSPFRGKKVLVVGSGNSAVDIAADLATVTESTSIAIRSPELITPKLFLGKPLGQVEGWFRKAWIPPQIPLLIRRLATWMVHGKMETWGIETPRGRTHPISQAHLIQHIAYRRVNVRKGVAGVTGNTVRFSDGVEEQYDVIIAATGYRLSFPFLPPETISVDRHGGLSLYGRAVAIKWPGLYFAGYFNTVALSNIRMMEYQARWIAEIETGLVLMPSIEAMEFNARALKRWLAKHYPPGPRYALELEPKPYLKFFDVERKLAKRRAQSTALSPAAVMMNRGTHSRLDDTLLSRIRSASGHQRTPSSDAV